MQKNPNDAWWSEDWEIDKGPEQMYAVLVFVCEWQWWSEGVCLWLKLRGVISEA